MTVKGLEKAGIIQKIEITKHINEHSYCSIELLLTDKEQWRQLKNMIDKEVLIEDDEYIYMRGILKDIHGNTVFSKSIAVVKIVSLSEKSDKKKKNRVFQYPQKTYNDIFSQVLDEYDIKAQIIDTKFISQTESNIIVQYDQTDFSFITKTANKNGYHIYINDTNKTCVFNIGKFGNNIQKKVEEEDIICLSYAIESERECLELKLHSYYEFGSRIEIENHIYTVISANIVFINGETSYCYKVCRELSDEHTKEESYEIFHVGLAKVINNEDPKNFGRIQVEFLNFEDSLPSDRTWIIYSNTFTERQGGVIFIPDKGEIVHVFIENGNGYADGCVRQTAIDNRFQDVKNRTIYVRDKTLMLNDKQINLTGIGYDIEVQEKGLYISGKNIKIDMEDEMSVECRDSRMKINKTNINLRSKSEIAIKADKIRLDGSNKISVKTSSFDVG